MQPKAQIEAVLAVLSFVASSAAAQSANLVIPSVQSNLRAPADLRGVRIDFRTEEHVRTACCLEHLRAPLAPQRVPRATVDFGLYVMWSEMPNRRARLGLPGELSPEDFARSFELTLIIRPLEDRRDNFVPELWELQLIQAGLDDLGNGQKNEGVKHFLIDQAGRILLGENEPRLPWYIGRAERMDGRVIVDVFTDMKVTPGDLDPSGILNQYEYRKDLQTLTLMTTAESRMLLLEYNHPSR